jgi:hypothetical protein
VGTQKAAAWETAGGLVMPAPAWARVRSPDRMVAVIGHPASDKPGRDHGALRGQRAHDLARRGVDPDRVGGNTAGDTLILRLLVSLCSAVMEIPNWCPVGSRATIAESLNLLPLFHGRGLSLSRDPAGDGQVALTARAVSLASFCACVASATSPWP